VNQGWRKEENKTWRKMMFDMGALAGSLSSNSSMKSHIVCRKRRGSKRTKEKKERKKGRY
jgi:hypothetical protein